MQAKDPPIHLWGVTAPLIPLAGGFRNRVLRTVGPAPAVVFKSHRRSPEAIGWLLAVQDCARASGFTVPRLIRSKAGLWTENGWTCEAYVDGGPFDPAEMPNLAPRIARFHRLTADLPQRPGFAASVHLLTGLSGGDVDLSVMPADLVADCRAAWQAVAAGPMAVVHGDLHAGNLLSCANGSVALLDWDECRRDLVLFDRVNTGEPSAAERRAALAWEVACCWQIEPDHARQMAQRLTCSPA